MKNCYSLAINYCLKIFTAILLFFPAAVNAQESMRVNLYVVDATGAILVDGNLTNYNSNYSNAVDINDAWKITNPGINFGILRDGYDLVVERRNVIGKTDTTFFKMWNMSQFGYRLKFMLKNLNHPGLTAVLKDNYLNREFPVGLNDTTNVDFSVTGDQASVDQKRFMLIFKKPPPPPVDIKFTAVDAQRNGKNVLLEWSVTNEVTVESYVVEYSSDGINFNALREQEPDNTQASKTYNYEYAESSCGVMYYRIKVVNSGGKLQYSPLAKVNALSTTQEIKVYPNPVVNKTVHLEFNNLPAGKYAVTLLYNNGSTRQLTSLQTGSDQNYSVNLPKELASGIYRLRITGPDGKSTYKSIYVVSE